MTEVDIKNQKFSIELSFTGIFRRKAAETPADFFGTEACHMRGTYDTWTVSDPEDKTWRLIHDPRIHGEWRLSGDVYLPKRDSIARVRLVTPLLSYDELPKLQACIQRIREAGAKVNATCDMSVHIDASAHNCQSIKNLICIMYSKEDVLFRALRVNEERAEVYSRKVREPVIQQIRTLSCDETKDLTPLEEIWFEGLPRPDGELNRMYHYALNPNSVFYRNTIEFRCFNATLDTGKIAAYLHLCLAIPAQAISQRSTVVKKMVSENEQYTFRVWLVRLGLNGDEFKQTRDILLSNLSGNKAWLRPKSAENGQKQRKKRNVER